MLLLHFPKQPAADQGRGSHYAVVEMWAANPLHSY